MQCVEKRGEGGGHVGGGWNAVGVRGGVAGGWQGGGVPKMGCSWWWCCDKVACDVWRFQPVGRLDGAHQLKVPVDTTHTNIAPSASVVYPSVLLGCCQVLQECK